MAKTKTRDAITEDEAADTLGGYTPDPDANGLSDHESEPVPWEEVVDAATGMRHPPAQEPDKAPRKPRKRRIGLGSSLEEIDAALDVVEATLDAAQREQRQLKALRDAITG